jgi:uncharacterized phage protein (TIGR02218 family)
MRQIPSELAAHLAFEATTLCHCWRATRRDGVVLGFTDHDEDIAFDGTLFRASSGLQAAEASASLGLAVGGGEVVGALGSDGLTEEDLSAGSWDCAKVEIFMVNWKLPDQRLRLRVGEIGEVRRMGAAFNAELRSMAHRLDARQGRLFMATCDAELGDARCGVDLDNALLRGEGAVVSATRFEVVAMGLGGFEERWFDGGMLTWTSGGNEGRRCEVRQHRGDRLGLWQGLPSEAAAGDEFVVTAGCDKRFRTCRERFANAANFRGFPHMPGTDRALGYPAGDEEHDGGSYFQ